MANEKTVLITGATGKQGGATARALAGKGFRLRAMTRNPDGDAAKAIAVATGAEIVQGDLNDAASLRGALKGAWGVFGVQNTWEAGVEGEEEQGKRLASLARETGVQHYVARQRQLRRNIDRDLVMKGDRLKERLQIVKAIGTPAENPQRPVDFCVGTNLHSYSETISS